MYMFPVWCLSISLLAPLLITINDFWLNLATGSGYNITRTRAAYVLWRSHQANYTSHWGRCAQRRSHQEGWKTSFENMTRSGEEPVRKALMKDRQQSGGRVRWSHSSDPSSSSCSLLVLRSWRTQTILDSTWSERANQEQPILTDLILHLHCCWQERREFQLWQ